MVPSLSRAREPEVAVSLALVSGGTQSLPRSQARDVQLWSRWCLVPLTVPIALLAGGPAKVPRTAAALQVASARREVSHRTDSTKASTLDWRQEHQLVGVTAGDAGLALDALVVLFASCS